MKKSIRFFFSTNSFGRSQKPVKKTAQAPTTQPDKATFSSAKYWLKGNKSTIFSLIGVASGVYTLYHTIIADAKRELNELDALHQIATLENFDAIVAGEPDNPKVRLMLHHNQNLNELRIVEKRLRAGRINNKMLQSRLRSIRGIPFKSRKNQILESLQEQLFRLELTLYLNKMIQAYITTDSNAMEKLITDVERSYVKRNFYEPDIDLPVADISMSEPDVYHHWQLTPECTPRRKLIDKDPIINKILANYYNIKGNYLRTYRPHKHTLKTYAEDISNSIASYNCGLNHAKVADEKFVNVPIDNAAIVSNIGFAYNKLAQVQSALNDENQSIESTKKALDHHRKAAESSIKDDNYPGILSGYGFGLHKSSIFNNPNDRDKTLKDAKSQYMLAEKILGTNADIIFNIADLFIDMGKEGEAIKLLEDIKNNNNKDSNHPDLLFLLAKAYNIQNYDLGMALHYIAQCETTRNNNSRQSLWYLNEEVDALQRQIDHKLHTSSVRMKN